MIKKNFDCCIGDFSQAVRYFSRQKKLDNPENCLNTELRYLAPEILNKNYDLANFESYRMSDVYSLSLVFWVLANRCEVKMESEYEEPYEKELNGADYSWENMMELIITKKCRPRIKDEWKADPVLKTLSQVMMECWNPNPTVRLTSLRIKKTLMKL